MNRRLTLGFILALGLVLIASSILAEDFKSRSFARIQTPSGEVEYAPGEVLVTFRNDVSLERMSEVARGMGSSNKSVHAGGRLKTYRATTCRNTEKIIMEKSEMTQISFTFLMIFNG